MPKAPSFLARNRFALFLMALIVAAVTAGSPTADAAGRKMSFIRDAEIEHSIRLFATPVFQAAGIDPNAVKIFLVKDKALNAFVAGGQKLFINTGLLMRAKNANEVIGVIAHEAGHIAGGHLVRLRDAQGQAAVTSILSTILAGAVTLGTGRGDVGSAVLAGGQASTLGNFLAFSRTQEGSADNAAVRYLDSTGQSARGLMAFMGQLADQELLSTRRQDPYMRTHPVTRERIEFLRHHVENSPHSDKPSPPLYDEMHARIRAKLKGFLQATIYTMRDYKNDDSLEARYAKAIAFYRRPDLDKALPMIDGLIVERPRDPFFWELKGQVLREHGRPAEALEPYRNAVALFPKSGLLRKALAQVQLDLSDPVMLEEAVDNLHAALHEEPDVPFTWRQLAIAYGRLGKMGESAVAMAEEAMLLNKPRDAAFHANKALGSLKEGTRPWIKARDILERTKKDGEEEDARR